MTLEPSIQSIHLTEPGIGLITMSFRGDLELCRLLCETIDTFVPPEFEHVLAVPRADLPLFRSMQNARRRLVMQEDLLPRWLHRLPLPSPAFRRLLGLPRRNMYVTRRGKLVRGWIAQQLMKLEAARQSRADAVMFVDSDVAFVKPFRRDQLIRDGRVRLMRTEAEGDTPMHHRWHLASTALLGLPPRHYHGADYIGTVAIWRSAVVRAMLERIASVQGKDAFEALASFPDLSEYTLYGIYCDHVTGPAESGHWPTDRWLCATVWQGLEPSQPREQRLDLIKIDDDQIAVGVQSTIPVPIEARRQLVSRLSGHIFR